MPTTSGRRCVPPSISGTPKRRSVKPRPAVSVAIRRSHHSASSRPPARHQPEIAATVGFDGVSRLNPIGPSGRAATASSTSEVSLRARLGHRLQVGAGAERLWALAGEHQHPRLLVALELAEAVEQQRGGLDVDGIAPLAPVDRQDGGGPRPLVANLGRHQPRATRGAPTGQPVGEAAPAPGGGAPCGSPAGSGSARGR